VPPRSSPSNLANEKNRYVVIILAPLMPDNWSLLIFHRSALSA
jgi:hypothetical protein